MTWVVHRNSVFQVVSSALPGSQIHLLSWLWAWSDHRTDVVPLPTSSINQLFLFWGNQGRKIARTVTILEILTVNAALPAKLSYHHRKWFCESMDKRGDEQIRRPERPPPRDEAWRDQRVRTG